MTPRMSHHARERCVEMGIGTKRAKAIVRNQRVQYRGAVKHGNDARIVTSDDPDYAVVWDPITNVILTVMPRETEPYVRVPGGYRLLNEESA